MIQGALSRIRLVLCVVFLIGALALISVAIAGPFHSGPDGTYGVSPAYANAARISARSMDAQFETRAEILEGTAEEPIVELAGIAMTSQAVCNPGGLGAGNAGGNRLRPRPHLNAEITIGGPLCTTERGSQCVTAQGTQCETHLSNPQCNSMSGSQCFTYQGTGCDTHRNNPSCNSMQGSQCETYQGSDCETHSNNPLCNSMRGSQCVTYDGKNCKTHRNNPYCNSMRGSQCETYDGPGCRTHRNNPLCNTARGSQCITYKGNACKTDRNKPDCNTVRQDNCITFKGSKCRTDKNNPDCGAKTYLNDPNCNTQASRKGGECITSRASDPACMTHVNNCTTNPFASPNAPGPLAPFFSDDTVDLHGAPERDLALRRPLEALATLLFFGLIPWAAFLRRRDA